MTTGTLKLTPATDYPEIDTDRNAVIARIKAALKNRSGKSWSVTGGRGTAWGWITITAMPKDCGEFGYMSEADREWLGSLMGFSGPISRQGLSVAASSDHYREYVDRAENREPRKIAEAYWD